AVALARASFTVVATMRNLGKAASLQARAKAEGVTLDVRQLDVQDEHSVDACVRDVLRDHGRIDVLVNNAGAGFLGTLEQTSFEDLRRTMDINFFGVWRVTRAVLPAMRAARSGRIISVTSIGGLIGQPFNDAYCAAKFAVEGWMESLAPVVKRLGIHVSLIEPGPVNAAYIAGTQEAFATVGQTGDDVAAVIVEAATAESPHLRYVTSDVVRGLVARKYVDPTGDTVLAMSGARLP
ncbi:MAG: SDR family oxidoreductase, partial [Deltaproteobacteria bacterium]